MRLSKRSVILIIDVVNVVMLVVVVVIIVCIHCKWESGRIERRMRIVKDAGGRE
jgi:hypothetical protein